MTNERQPVDVPLKARESIRDLIAQKKLADAQFQTYVKGCFEAMGLDGDWDLDTKNWIFNPREEVPK